MRITVERILSWHPCDRYDEARLRKLFGRRESVTVGEVLRCRRVPPVDRLWLVLREEVLPAAVLREFAATCAVRALEQYGAALTAEQMDACLWACDVASAIAAGADIPEEERAAAGAAAGAAAWDAAGAAAWDAAWAAAWDAAWAAARDAAWAAAGAAAGAAAWDAAWAAAGAAAWDAAWAAAGAAEAEAQCRYLAALARAEEGGS
ncbi:MAG: hypothetical protein WC789_09395 [Lentisphaeria bacterium]